MDEIKEILLSEYKRSNSKLLKKFTDYLIDDIKKRNLTQAEFAEEIGVDVKTVSRWARGINKCSLCFLLIILQSRGFEGFIKYLKENPEK